MFLFWTGYTPLHHCLTMYGTAETLAMARLLLERGADPNARTRFGNVPLWEAVTHQKIDFINLLLEFEVI
jgi:ankyrin repeat protein